MAKQKHEHTIDNRTLQLAERLFVANWKPNSGQNTRTAKQCFEGAKNFYEYVEKADADAQLSIAETA